MSDEVRRFLVDLPKASLCMTNEVENRWAAYAELAKKWGAKTDLTSATTESQLLEILLLDAAHILQGSLLDDAKAIVDIGAGVGAPTLPLVLAVPDLRATLVEPRRKRVAFLRFAVGALDLQQRVSVVEGRIDPASPNVAGTPFDVALSRATFAPAEWLTIGERLADRVIVFLANQQPPSHTALLPQKTHRYTVPSSQAPRALVLFGRSA